MLTPLPVTLKLVLPPEHSCALAGWLVMFTGLMTVNRAEFDHDMQKLVAARRPTMHVRTVDGVRLVELICVVQRLSEQMADDGAWKGLAETDR